MRDDKMIIGMSIRGLGYHPAAWRHPDVPADGTMLIEHYVRSAKAAEKGKCHLIFFADGIAIREHDIPKGALSRLGYEIVEMEPLTLLPALAMVTEKIGLVTTASTSYNEPFHVARKFATLDLISKGRAGWNVVTSWSEAEALNFGRERHFDYATRYDRADEFVDVVKSLWDSWEEGAFVVDKEKGIFHDEAKKHTPDYKGNFFNVKGPLNVAGMPQGHPVIVEAGASEQGRELAAKTADIVYAIIDTKEKCKAYYDDVKGRMAKYGRDPSELKIMPSVRPTVASTEVEAQTKLRELQDLLDPLVGKQRLASLFGDLSDYDVDGPVPLDSMGPREIKSINASRLEWIKKKNPSIRQLYERIASETGLSPVGTPEMIADQMQEWFEFGACDGFNITPQILPSGCEDFVELVIPELQRRGLFHTEYAGSTLRENAGLKRPGNRYAQS